MDLTYQMVISALCAESVDVADYSHAGDPPVRGVETYPGGGGIPAGDRLYLTPLDVAVAADAGQPLSFLCACPGPPPATLLTRNHIAIAQGVGPDELADRAHRVFAVLSRWIIDLQASVIANEGVQALLDLSRPLLQYPVLLVDPTRKLLAAAGGDETSADIRRARALLDRIRLEPGPEDPVIDAAFAAGGTSAPCPVVRTSFPLSRTFFLCAFMPCFDGPPARGLADLFGLLCQCIRAYVKRGYPYSGTCSAFDSLLQDLLDGQLCDGPEIALRASRTPVPFAGQFDLYQIALSDADAQPLASLALSLQNKLPHSHISVYQKSIVVLNLYSGEAAAGKRSDRNLRTVGEILGGQVRGVGVSNPFLTLSDLRRAFRQAGAALSAGAVRQPDAGSAPPEAPPPVHRFEDLYVDYLLLSLREAADGLYDNGFARRTLDRLLALQERHNYDYIGFLYTYLLAERRPAVVGRQLQLHRNTVLYHIHKLEDALGFSLEDPQLRLKLILELTRALLEAPPQGGGAPPVL